MKIHGHDIGVCSWSLRPRDMRDLVAVLTDVGVQHLQLALAPMLSLNETQRAADFTMLRNAGVKLTAGMVSFPGEDYSSIALIRKTGGYVPDAEWELRRDLTIAAAKLASEIGVDAITTHIGFVPASNDPAYAKIIQRVGEVADALAAMNVTLLMETGQETASELLQFLNDLRQRNVDVNFDPANMILYGAGDPIDAVRILGRHIKHVHVKDATLSDHPRMKWGNEVPFGTGQVRPRRFIDALDAAGYTGPLVIEREAGEDRAKDVRAAITAIQQA